MLLEHIDVPLSDPLVGKGELILSLRVRVPAPEALESRPADVTTDLWNLAVLTGRSIDDVEFISARDLLKVCEAWRSLADNVGATCAALAAVSG